MKNKDEQVSAKASNDGPRQKFHETFAASLSKELDAIGYSSGGQRSLDLADALGLGRPQVYRLLNGASYPTVDVMVTLRRIGCSIDRIIDAAAAYKAEVVRVKLGEQVVAARVRKSPRQGLAGMYLRPKDGVYELAELENESDLENGWISIEGLDFIKLPRIAILDDDLTTLDLLSKELSGQFAIDTYSTGKSLLESISTGTKQTAYEAVLVDWRLPDVSGEFVVETIRQASPVPIFILTGDSTASSSIVRMLDLPNVNHVSKPFDSLILAKKLQQALVN